MKKTYIALMLLLSPIISYGAIIDSYNESNRNSDNSFEQQGTGDYFHQCQSFASTGDYTLTGGAFVLSVSATMTGTIALEVWSVLGTYGTNAEPDTLLATSDTVNNSTLTTSPTVVTFTFSGAEQISITNGTKYFLCTQMPTGNGNNTTRYGLIGRDSTSPTHGGEIAYDSDGAIETWTSVQVHNYPFYVYGDVVGGGGGSETATSTGNYFDSELGNIIGLGFMVIFFGVIPFILIPLLFRRYIF